MCDSLSVSIDISTVVLLGYRCYPSRETPPCAILSNHRFARPISSRHKLLPWSDSHWYNGEHSAHTHLCEAEFERHYNLGSSAGRWTGINKRYCHVSAAGPRLILGRFGAAVCWYSSLIFQHRDSGRLYIIGAVSGPSLSAGSFSLPNPSAYSTLPNQGKKGCPFLVFADPQNGTVYRGSIAACVTAGHVNVPDTGSKFVMPLSIAVTAGMVYIAGNVMTDIAGSIQSLSFTPLTNPTIGNPRIAFLGQVGRINDQRILLSKAVQLMHPPFIRHSSMQRTRLLSVSGGWLISTRVVPIR